MNPFMKTLKKIAAAYNGVSLILRIAIGLDVYKRQVDAVTDHGDLLAALL